MEKIQDFFKNVNERLRNPFLFSLLISWLIANYKVVIGLCFYSIADVKLDGYNSYFDLISQSVTWKTGILYPIIGAIIYTFIIPLLRMIIVLYYTRINQTQEKRALNILKDGYISTEKYLRLRENYKQSQDQLVKVIDEESEFLKKRGDLMLRIENLRKESTEANNKIESLENELAPLRVLKEKTDRSFMAGEWFGAFIMDNIEVDNQIEFEIDLSLMQMKLKLKGLPFGSPFSIVNLMRSDRTIFLEFFAMPPAVLPKQVSRYIVFNMLHEHHIKGEGSNGITYDLEKRVHY